jgi:hypothetical protein
MHKNQENLEFATWYKHLKLVNLKKENNLRPFQTRQEIDPTIKIAIRNMEDLVEDYLLGSLPEKLGAYFKARLLVVDEDGCKKIVSREHNTIFETQIGEP